MDNFNEKIRNEVREKSKDMDEGDIENWIDEMLSEIKVLETKCFWAGRILTERAREFLKRITK